MAAFENKTDTPDLPEISSRDILFECPACGKSLVVDEAAQGLIIDCPRCHINVIVPPRRAPAIVPPGPATETVASTAGQPVTGTPEERLMALSNQLKELQTQRTEISNRLASRLNEINRDLVMMARLETTQQQILSEWNQLAAQLARPVPPTTVLGSSVSSGRSRVQFRS
jgi:phage FluMu protein Com